MDKQKLIELGATEEQAANMLAAMNETMIPKHRFDAVNNEKNSLKDTLEERDKEIAKLKKTTGNVDELNQKIAKLEADNQTTIDKYTAEIAGIKKSTAIEKALLENKAKNVKATMALLDLETISFENDELTGFNEQITKLKEDDSTKFLFVTEDITPVVGGAKPAKGNPAPAQNQNISLADAIKNKFSN